MRRWRRGMWSSSIMPPRECHTLVLCPFLSAPPVSRCNSALEPLRVTFQPCCGKLPLELLGPEPPGNSSVARDLRLVTCDFRSPPPLLPAIEEGLFSDSWRIRHSSVELLGDLLFKVRTPGDSTVWHVCRGLLTACSSLVYSACYV